MYFCAFDVFNVEMIPGNISFKVCGLAEMKILGNHYHKENSEKMKGLLEQWDDFKFDLLDLKEKWQQFKKKTREL